MVGPTGRRGAEEVGPEGGAVGEVGELRDEPYLVLPPRVARDLRDVLRNGVAAKVLAQEFLAAEVSRHSDDDGLDLLARRADLHMAAIRLHHLEVDRPAHTV